MEAVMGDEFIKLGAHALVYLVGGVFGWFARKAWKLAADVGAAEEKLDIPRSRWVRILFGWLLLPLRVKRIEEELGIGNGRYTWQLVRTRRVNECFAEIRKKNGVTQKPPS